MRLNPQRVRLVAGSQDALRHLPYPAATKQEQRGNGHTSLIDKPSFGGEVLHVHLQLVKTNFGICNEKPGETIPTLPFQQPAFEQAGLDPLRVIYLDITSYCPDAKAAASSSARKHRPQDILTSPGLKPPQQS